MNYYEVASTRLIGPKAEVLTYCYVDKLMAGQLVLAPIGQKNFVGVVMKKVAKPKFACKEITQVLFDVSLPPALLKLATWLGQFYAAPTATVWQTILPAGLAKKRRVKSVKSAVFQRERTHFLLNQEQSAAVENILKSNRVTTLLHGITGSGKTAVYKTLTERFYANSQSSIILVPEISLTSQLVAEFQNDFANVFTFHSTMTEAERAAVWADILRITSSQQNQPVVVIGPRSALFLPIANLGLIVIDECHEPSYKQDRSPKYDTLRAAAILAQNAGAKLVLGSATPSVTDYYLAQQKQAVVELKNLANKDAQPSVVTIIDMTRPENRGGALSPTLIAKIKKVLNEKKQVLIFHNRRGTASATLCAVCGWSALCPRCFVPLTLHGDHFRLRCHICGYSEKTPTTCPVCNSTDIIHKGLGTKQLESELKKLFPQARVARFDGDNSKGERLNDRYQEIYDGKIDIIIGTQTIAKGLDLPNLRLVGIPQADAGLLLPDFSARERTFQLIAQAVGRVGRGRHATEVMVQSFQANSPVVRHGAAQNYADFYKNELAERRKGHFPPFVYLLKATNSYKTEHSAVKASQDLARRIAQDGEHLAMRSVTTDSKRGDKPKLDWPAPKNLHILGPAPAFYERQRDTWRWQIIVRSSSRTQLQQIAKQIPPDKWQTELDPNSLL
jgi:primosomal protein N' (replication factor Y)